MPLIIFCLLHSPLPFWLFHRTAHHHLLTHSEMLHWKAETISEMTTKASLRFPGINNQVVWVSHPRSECKAVNSSLCTHVECACLRLRPMRRTSSLLGPANLSSMKCLFVLTTAVQTTLFWALSVPFLCESRQSPNSSISYHTPSRSLFLDSGSWTSGTLDKKEVSMGRPGLVRVIPFSIMHEQPMWSFTMLSWHSLPHSEHHYHP